MAIAPGMHVDDPSDDSLNLSMSEAARPLFDAVKKFITDEVEPITAEFYELGEDREDRWSYTDDQLQLLESVKNKARSSGLWNFFLPDDETGQGLSNLDYAYYLLGICYFEQIVDEKKDMQSIIQSKETFKMKV